jgi:hypothetical protein
MLAKFETYEQPLNDGVRQVSEDHQADGTCDAGRQAKDRLVLWIAPQVTRTRRPLGGGISKVGFNTPLNACHFPVMLTNFIEHATKYSVKMPKIRMQPTLVPATRAKRRPKMEGNTVSAVRSRRMAS